MVYHFSTFCALGLIEQACAWIVTLFASLCFVLHVVWRVGGRNLSTHRPLITFCVGRVIFHDADVSRGVLKENV